MKISSLYRPGSFHTTTADSLRKAATTMADHHLTCLPVLNGAAVVGIITEHDVVDAYAHAVPASEACVVDYVSDDPVAVSLDDDCDVAELKMVEIGCHDLPVVVGDRLVGSISERELIVHRGDRPAAGQAPSRWPAEPPPDVDSET